jgi:PIN domain nuclease of toxin-antitoxin system
MLHRDPFDRLLVVQALQHGLSMVTVDPSISAYQVNLLSEK